MVLPRSLVLACVLVCVSVVGQVSKVDAFNVLGCNFNPGDNPESCINGKINEQVNQAKNEMNTKVNDANKKAQEAQRQADAARQELQNSPNLARLRGEQLMLQSVRTLQLEPLIQCLESNRAFPQADLAQYVARAGSNPGELAKWVLEDLLRHVEGDFDRLMAEEIQVLRQPSMQAMQRLASPDAAIAKLQRLAERHPAARCLSQHIAPRMQMLRQAGQDLQTIILIRANAMYDAKVKPVVMETIGRGTASLVQLTQRLAQEGTLSAVQTTAPLSAPIGGTGQPAPGTPSPAFGGKPGPSPQSELPAVLKESPQAGAMTIPPPPQQEKVTQPAGPQDSGQLQQGGRMPAGAVRKRSVDGNEEIAEDANVTSRGLGEYATTNLPTGSEIYTIANGIISRHLLSPTGIAAKATSIRTLAAALPNPQARATALTTVQQQLAPNIQVPVSVYLEIGMEILRFMGHKFINSESGELSIKGGFALPPGGAFMVTQGAQSLSFVKDGFMSIGLGLCGLPPAVAINCSFAKTMAEGAFDYLFVPGVRMATLLAANTAYDLFIDQAKEAVMQARTPQELADRLHRISGPFAPLADQIHHEILLQIVDGLVKDTRLALDQYNASVRELADASVRR